MRIAYDKISTLIEVRPENIEGLVVENPEFLYQLLMDLKKSLEGNENGFVFSKQDRIVPASRTVEFVADFINLQLGEKRLMNKILSGLEHIALSGRFYQETQMLMTSIENYVMNLTLDIPFDLVCEKQNIQGLFKGLGLSVADKYDSLEERILVYMDLVREFEEKELFIFFNLRSFIPQKRLELMVNTALEREHSILLIDSKEYPKLEKEHRLIIDEDLCEI